ncbi:Endocytosis and vacuole integrity protein [Dispira simplex]|nr:Endocytosis and vacuole integrity protein [Dispira simplex]
MSGLASTLMAEFGSLSSEARRKHPDIKEASERVIFLLRSINTQEPDAVGRELARNDEAIRPFTLACSTKQVKLITVALGCLHRLITNCAVHDMTIPTVLSALNDIVLLGVDMQLKTLQLLLPLLANYPGICGPVLSQALTLCCRLQESKIVVVNNTAAATLRQLVILVFEKVAKDSTQISPVQQGTQTESSHPLTPTATDAKAVFEDLCLVTSGSPPKFITATGLTKTFGLELLESVLTYQYGVFHRHPHLRPLLREHMCPVVIKLFSDHGDFPCIMRVIRLFFISIKRLRRLIPIECEIYITMLIRLLEPDQPLWQRVLAMEVFREMSNDGELLRFLYREYDRREKAKPVFQDLIATIGRIATEKPASLGLATGSAASFASPAGSAILERTTGDLTPDTAQSNSEGDSQPLDASVLSRGSSAPRIQFLDQLDKVEPPVIPGSYLFYLSVGCVSGVVQSLVTPMLPLLTTAEAQPPLDAGESDHTWNNTVLDMAAHPHTDALQLTKDMTETAWPGLLAAFSFYLTTRLDDDIFRQLVEAFRSLTILCGALGLTTPRDALLTSLCKHCLPLNTDKYVASRDGSRPTGISTPEPTFTSNGKAGSVGTAVTGSLNTLVASLTTGGTNLGSGSLPTGLSPRNFYCLQRLLEIAYCLGERLDSTWYTLLLTLQHADELLGGSAAEYLLYQRSTFSSNRSSTQVLHPQPRRGSQSSTTTDLSPLDMYTASCYRLLDRAMHLSVDPYTSFVRALCCLSCGLAGVSPPRCDVAACQRVYEEGGMHRRLAVVDQPSFALVYIEYVMMKNLDTLLADTISKGPYRLLMDHLVDVTLAESTPPTIRTQACQIIAEVAEKMFTTLQDPSSVEDPYRVQMRVLEPLARVVQHTVMGATISDLSTSPASLPSIIQTTTSSTLGVSPLANELAQKSLETLNRILHSAGHSIAPDAWNIIFDMVSVYPLDTPAEATVSKDPGAGELNDLETFTRTLLWPQTQTVGLPPIPTKTAQARLIRHAFPCLQLICTDFLSALPADCLGRCIQLLGSYGAQPVDINVALTAIGLFWNIADYLSTVVEDITPSAPSSILTHDAWERLWVLLIYRLLRICVDPRNEVRNGANRTLFRTLDLKGDTLSVSLWYTFFWYLLNPLAKAVLRCRVQIARKTKYGGVDVPMGFVPMDFLVREDWVDQVPQPTTPGEDDSADTPTAVPTVGDPLLPSSPSTLHSDGFRPMSKAWDETLGLVVSGLTKLVRNQVLLPATRPILKPESFPKVAGTHERWPVWRWLLKYCDTVLYCMRWDMVGESIIKTVLQASSGLLANWPLELDAQGSELAQSSWLWWQCAWVYWLRLGAWLLPAAGNRDELEGIGIADICRPPRHAVVVQDLAQEGTPVPIVWGDQPEEIPTGLTEPSNWTVSSNHWAAYLGLYKDLLALPVVPNVSGGISVDTHQVLVTIVTNPSTHLAPLLRRLKSVALADRPTKLSARKSALSTPQTTVVELLSTIAHLGFQAETLGDTDIQKKLEVDHHRCILDLIVDDWVDYLLVPYAALGLPVDVIELSALEGPWARMSYWRIQFAKNGVAVSSSDSIGRPEYLSLAYQVLKLATVSFTRCNRRSTALLLETGSYNRLLDAQCVLLQLDHSYHLQLPLGALQDKDDSGDDSSEAYNSSPPVTQADVPFRRVIAQQLAQVVEKLLPRLSCLQGTLQVGPTQALWYSVLRVSHWYLFGCGLIPVEQDNLPNVKSTLLASVPAPTALPIWNDDTVWFTSLLQVLLRFSATTSTTLGPRQFAQLVHLLWRGATLDVYHIYTKMTSIKSPVIDQKDLPTTVSTEDTAAPVVPTVAREKFGWTCLGFLFALADEHAEDIDGPVSPVLAELATCTLVTHGRNLLQSYVHDQRALGHCPLPRLRQEELLFTLQGLCRLLVRDDVNLDTFDAVTNTLVGGKQGRSMRHLLVLYPYLCQAILLPNPAVLALVYKCLERVGNIWSVPVTG